MENQKEVKILAKFSRFYWIMVIVVLLSIILNMFVGLFMEKNEHEFKIKNYDYESMDNNIKVAKNIATYIGKRIQNTDEQLIDKLKERLYAGIELFGSDFPKLSKQEKYNFLHENFKRHHFFKRRGYYFAVDLNGEMILNVGNPSLEKQNFSQEQVIIDIINIVRNENEGLVKGKWYLPNNLTRKFAKWLYVKRIPNTDIIIGVGDYYNIYIDEMKQELLNDLVFLNVGNSEYLTIIDKNTNEFLFLHDKKIEEAKSVYETYSRLDDELLEYYVNKTHNVNEAFIDRIPSLKFSKIINSSGVVRKVEVETKLSWLIVSYTDPNLIKLEQNKAISRAYTTIILRNIILIAFVFLFSLIFNLYSKNLMQRISGDLEDLYDFVDSSKSTIKLIPPVDTEFYEINTIKSHIIELISHYHKQINDSIQDKLFLDNLINDNPEPIAVVDINGNIQRINYLFTKEFEYDENECLGKNVDLLLSRKNDLARAKRETFQVKNGQKTSFNGIRISKTGKQLNMQITGIPIEVASKIVSIFVIYQNRTKQLEYETNLKIASQQALDAVKIKSQFLATMSHEIRTPMNGVLGMADLLSKTSLSTEQREYVETISLSGDSLLRIINDILDFSKIESNKFELHETEVNIPSVIEDVLSMVNYADNSKFLKLYYDIDSDLPEYVIADRGRLKQILINIINNSWKFSDSGYINISVKIAGKNNGRYKLEFVIKDTGIGIPADKLSTIFESFTQVDSSNTRRYTGTGLGLAICKSLTKAMGGDIWIDSKYKEGTRTTFTIQVSLSNKTISKTNDDKIKNLKVLVLSNRLLFNTVSSIVQKHVTAVQLIPDNDSFENFIEDIEMSDVVIYSNEAYSTKINSIFPNTNKKFIYVTTEDKLLKNNNNTIVNQLSYPLVYNKFYQLLFDMYGIARITKKHDESKVSEIVTNQNVKILVAEDNKINQKLIQRMFKKLDINIDLAVDGMEAVNMFEKSVYDIIFMDLQMPNIDGIQASNYIFAYCLENNIVRPKIIALTANVFQEDKEKCKSAGMIDFLAKPFKLDDLKVMIDRYM